MHKNDESTIFFLPANVKKCPFCNALLEGLDPENAVAHLDRCPKNKSRVMNKIVNRENWFRCVVCAREIYRKDNYKLVNNYTKHLYFFLYFRAHMLRVHRPTEGLLPDESEDPSELLESPSNAEIKSLIQGHIEMSQLVVLTAQNQHNYSKKMGTRGQRSSFLFTKFARRLCSVGLILEVISNVINKLLDTHKVDGASRCLVVLYAPGGGLDYPFSRYIHICFFPNTLHLFIADCKT